MESLSLWLAEHGTALWTLIISVVSVYGVGFLALIVAVIKLKLKEIRQSQIYSEATEKYMEKLENRLDELEKSLLDNNNANAQKRLDAINKIAESVKEANETLQPVKPLDANSALDNLE